jgi:hypothetical protein
MEQTIRLERRFAILDEWLLDLDISDRAVRLYAVLARYADNDTHKAYPSRETLATRLRCSTKSVDRAALELVEQGAMTKQQRTNSSIIYTLRVVQGGGHQSPGGSTRVSRGVDTGVELTRTTELEPRELEPTNYISPLFEQFWDIYPAKKGKGSAAAAFAKALKRVSANELLEAVTRFRDDPHRPSDFTPHPTTWLNQDRWGDDAYQKPDRDKTNSERNVENLRNAMSLLENTKEVERGQVTGESVTDFGVSFRSAENI